MAARSFRDRFFTPQVARAITSPAGILLAGAGASAAILAGFPLVGIVGLGALAWAGRVAVAIPRGHSGPGTGAAGKVDPGQLGEPWRSFVTNALHSRRKFAEATSGAKSGPLQTRLEEIGNRLDEGIDECWRIARQGQVLTGARSKLDAGSVQRELDELEAEIAGSVSGSGAAAEGSPQHRTLEALRAQLASAQRLDRALTDARDQLRLLDARFDEAVARAVELSVRASDAGLEVLGSDVDGMVGDMEALRQGLEEANQSPPALG